MHPVKVVTYYLSDHVLFLYLVVRYGRGCQCLLEVGCDSWILVNFLFLVVWVARGEVLARVKYG